MTDKTKTVIHIVLMDQVATVYYENLCPTEAYILW